MKRLSIFVQMFILVMLLSSCSPKLSPFTDNVYTSLRGSESTLSKVQFYLSGDIVLQREVGSKNSKVDNGVIKLVKGRKVEEVIFKRGTPGVFVFSPKSERIAISFENNDENYLMFGVNEKAGGRFVLLAKEWNRKRGKVSYAGKTWNASSESAYSNLMVDLDRAMKTRVKKKTVAGRKV